MALRGRSDIACQGRSDLQSQDENRKENRRDQLAHSVGYLLLKEWRWRGYGVGPISPARAGAICRARMRTERKIDAISLRICCVPPFEGMSLGGLTGLVRYRLPGPERPAEPR